MLLTERVQCLEKKLKKTRQEREVVSQQHLEKSGQSYYSFLEGAGQGCAIFVCSRTASVT